MRTCYIIITSSWSVNSQILVSCFFVVSCELNSCFRREFLFLFSDIFTNVLYTQNVPYIYILLGGGGGATPTHSGRPQNTSFISSSALQDPFQVLSSEFRSKFHPSIYLNRECEINGLAEEIYLNMNTNMRNGQFSNWCHMIELDIFTNRVRSENENAVIR